ncbi:MAG: Fic family protein [Beijerinckiaceae bacterium]
MLKSSYRIPELPPPVELETKAVLRAAAEAHRHLAEVKGRAAAMPNQGILIDTLSLQEAKASSEIENIVTTQDELFQTDLFNYTEGSAAAKEVALYSGALKLGFEQMKINQGLITANSIVAIFQKLKRTDGGYRSTPGTALRNDRTGDIVYVPPQRGDEIIRHMSALERFINDDALSSLDPLIKMALIHHQFESIHPFPDGNGRIGRILNVLYLTRTDLLETPVLYLSRAITDSKSEYYRLLQAVRNDNDWEGWVLYMLRAISSTSQTTLHLIDGIRTQMAEMKQRLRQEQPKLYSQDLLNNLFRHPYTRIEYVQTELDVTRQTAARYLDQLATDGFLLKLQVGRNNYYVNQSLVALLSQVSAPG